MHEYADRLDQFLGDHHDGIIVALVLLVLAQAVAIWLRSRRAHGLRRRLETAAEAASDLQRRLQATAEAATHDAAVALAADELHLVEGDDGAVVTPPPPYRVATPWEACEAPAAVPAVPGVALGEPPAWFPPVDTAATVEAAAIAPTPPPAAPAGPARSDAVRLLLLVEDDVNVARPYRLLLESRGYTVLHATDGVEGLDAARRERPDLLLLDVMMPRMNGISLLQAVREDANLRTTPAVVLSNFHEPRMVERAMALGALDYIVKAQMELESLITAIPHWLRGERVAEA